MKMGKHITSFQTTCQHKPKTEIEGSDSNKQCGRGTVPLSVDRAQTSPWTGRGDVAFVLHDGCCGRHPAHHQEVREPRAINSINTLRQVRKGLLLY